MPRRVLVLGATSLIGRRLLALPPPEGAELIALSRRGPEPFPLEGGRAGMGVSAEPVWKGSRGGGASIASRFNDRARTPTPAPPPSRGREESPGLQWLTADLTAPNLQLPPADAILSLSPIWLLPPALPALLATGAKRIVAFSSTSRLTKENSPVEAERAVAARLAAGEAALIAACEAAGVGWTILRPTLIYAEGEDANVSRLARLIARFGVLPLSGSGAGLRQPVHAEDLATAAWAALDAPAAAGKTYALPGGETLTYRAMCERIFQALGRRPCLLSLPPPVWRAALALASPVLPGVTSAMGGRMGEDLAFDPAPAQHDFGYAPRPFRPNFA